MKNNFMVRYMVLAVLMFFNNAGIAQTATRVITGIITSVDEGVPLENAGVWVKGTDKRSGTQADGIYYISVSSKDSILVFAADEFEEQEIKITKGGEYNVRLQRKNTAAFSAFGKWRGVFRMKDSTEIPFNFEITGNSIANAKVFFVNGEERFEAGSLRQKNDSIFITTSPFDNEMAFKINNGSLEGVLRKQDRSGSQLALKAEHADYRFATSAIEPTKNISGTYAVSFKNDAGADEKAVGLFAQDGQHLKATFLRITGDSRYLDGEIEGNTFKLSSFIGSVPSYYKGKIAADGKLSGEIISPRGKQIFEAVPDESAALPDAYQLTFLKDGYSTLDFSFPDINGKLVSLKDSKYKNKVVVITIAGTWCPNCIDEAAFLSPWYKANRQRGIEVIAIHYERQTDTAYLRKAIKRFNQKFDIHYDEIIGGIADKQKVAESLPALNSFLSFPTTIFIDRKGKVSKIHTGFNGPATGKYYTEFVKEFNQEVDKLVNER